MRSEIDQREGSKAGWPTSDECAVCLVALHEPSLNKNGTLGPTASALAIVRTYRHDPDKDARLAHVDYARKMIHTEEYRCKYKTWS
jgi:hypothetical protein